MTRARQQADAVVAFCATCGGPQESGFFSVAVCNLQIKSICWKTRGLIFEGTDAPLTSLSLLNKSFEAVGGHSFQVHLENIVPARNEKRLVRDCRGLDHSTRQEE